MSGSGITPTIPNAAQSSAPKGQVVQIISLPDGLKNNARALRIDGEVIQQNKDGSVRVRTDQGDIDIQVRGKQPQTGAKIEVDIPAGNPPRTATIRPALQLPAPVAPQAPSQTPVQTPVQYSPSTTQAPAQHPQTQGQTQNQATPPPPQILNPPAPQSSLSTPPVQQTAPAATVQHQAAVPQQPTTLPPLSAGQTVQLVPLTDTIQPQPVQPEHGARTIDPISAPATTAAADTLVTKVTAQKVQGGLIGNLLQAVKSAIPSIPATPAPIQLSTSAPSTPPQITTVPFSQELQPQSFTLTAKILSILPPLDQRIFVAQPSSVAGQPVPFLSGENIPPLTVSVEAITAQNKPVVQIPLNEKGAVQNFILQAASTGTPPGTQITLLPQAINTAPDLPIQKIQIQTQIQSQALPTIAISPSQVSSIPSAWRPLFPLMQAMPLWPVINDIFQSFYQTTPQAAQILGRIIPSPANASSFGPAVMLFAAALKSGDLQGWIGGKKLDMIQKLGKDDLIARLGSEASSLPQNTDAPATDWKSYPIPLLYQNEISKILFHVRREPDENADQDGKDTTRFVMDISLPRMGTVQLDAFVRGNRIDLTVRTELPVSAAMQDAMRSAYATALDGTAVYGDIGFQSDVKNFVTILKQEDALARA